MSRLDFVNHHRSKFAIAFTYFVARLLVALSVDPRSFPDSSSYSLAGSKTVRPYGISALFEVLGAPARIVIVQTIVVACSTLWLAAEVDRRSRPAAALLLALSLLKPFTMWDHTVLSETLSFAVCAALAASLLWWQRTERSMVSVATAGLCAVLCALTREPVFLIFGVPALLWIAVSLAKQKTRPEVIQAGFCVGLIFVLSFIALKPSTTVYDQRGTSLDNFRTFNVIGQRVLPNPYLRAKLEGMGMPKTGLEDHVNRYAMDGDYRLYAIPGMLEFANDFPTARYILAEASRPTLYLRYAKASVDAIVFEQTKVYEEGAPTDRLIPEWAEKLVTRWSASLHLLLLCAAFAATVATRRYGLSLAASWVAFLATGGAVLAGTVDAMERQRHALPFTLIARVAIVIVLVEVAIHIVNKNRTTQLGHQVDKAATSKLCTAAENH